MKLVLALDLDHATELARFELVDERVIAVYHSTWFATAVERGIVRTPRSGVLRPSDGVRFFESLERAFANSSRLDVITVATGEN